MTSFPEFITERRRELELTLGDVANSLGVSPITVSNWSSGDSKPKPENLVGLAALLDVPADTLAKMAGVTLERPADTGVTAVNLIPPTATAADAAPVTEEADDSAPVAVVSPARPPDRGGPEDRNADLVDAELAELIDEAAPEPAAGPEKVPAFVAAKPAPPAPARQPAKPRSGDNRPVPEREVLTLPLTYIEDPRQLMRYRIRWALTIVALAVMFLILLWASRELISALSEVKQAVTPGGSLP